MTPTQAWILFIAVAACVMTTIFIVANYIANRLAVERANHKLIEKLKKLYDLTKEDKHTEIIVQVRIRSRYRISLESWQFSNPEAADYT